MQSILSVLRTNRLITHAQTFSATLCYWDSAKAMVRDPSENPLNVININEGTTVGTIVNPNHTDKFCFQITLASGQTSNALSQMEQKFSKEELEQCEALFAAADDDGSGSSTTRGSE